MKKNDLHDITTASINLNIPRMYYQNSRRSSKDYYAAPSSLSSNERLHFAKVSSSHSRNPRFYTNPHMRDIQME